MKVDDRLFWVWLSGALKTAQHEYYLLMSLYHTPYDIFLAEPEELERIDSLTDRSRKALSDKSLTRATEILEQCERLGIKLVHYGEKSYPGLLSEIKDPPILLYYKGTLPDLSHGLTIGMVGTRHMSAYGLKNAYRLAYDLASEKAVIVSGMAAGIDGVCAAAALKAGGFTVAVLGCGVDIVYPAHHKVLMKEIAERGLLISEYPPGTRPTRYHFPVRNRLISGMSHGTVVVEAGVKSGSLITAKNTILQGRSLFALPANVGQRGSEGTNGLLRDGVTPITSAADIFEDFSVPVPARLSREGGDAYSIEPDLPYLASLGVISLGEGGEPLHTTATLKTTRTPSARKESASVKPAEKSADPPAKEKRSVPRGEQTFEPSPRTTRSDVQTPDGVISSLTDLQRAILEAIPDDRAVSLDSLSGLEASYGDIIASLTMLEILGLVQKLPGALYTKT